MNTKLKKINRYNNIIDNATAGNYYKLFAELLEDNDEKVLEAIGRYVLNTYKPKYKRSLQDLKE